MGASTFKLPDEDDPNVSRSLRWLLKLLAWPDQLARNFARPDIYQRRIEGHGISYLTQLFGQYDALGDRKANAPQAEEFIRELRQRALKLEELDSQLAREKGEAKRAELKRDLHDNRITWDDVLRFEGALLRLLPEAELRIHAGSIRAEYKEIAGDAIYGAYLERHPPDPQKEQNVEVVRADAQEVLNQLHWLYAAEPVHESQRTRLLFTVLFNQLGVCAVAAMVALGWLIYRLQVPEARLPIIFLVLFFGALGGSLSSLLRLQTTTFAGNATVVNLWKLNHLGVSALLAPFIGALSAVLLMLLFAGGFLNLDVVPKIAIHPACMPCDPCETNLVSAQIVTNRTNVIPATNATPATNGIGGTNAMHATNAGTAANASKALDATNLIRPVAVVASNNVALNGSAQQRPGGTNEGAGDGRTVQRDRKEGRHLWPYHICLLEFAALAKLLIWCFIAGFSERLVPDIIDRLANKANGSK